ncbi:hypothetical protein [Flavisolibacter tropicus]|uniref:hypothetical protein n=1 Tax=Flavisolibacter tropicus TaxID=1492898 RepID=UPI001313FB32|nr:hypothetical protein [Flavisolibacter tropicus]
MKVILPHPTGYANVRETVNGLENENILTGLHTSIASIQGNIFDKIGAIGVFLK